MIKVNLLRSMGLDQSGGGGLAAGGGVVSTDMRKQAAIKLAAILSISVLIAGYQKFNVAAIQVEVRDAEEAVQRIEEQTSKFGPTGPRVEKYTKEKAQIEKEIEIIRGLTRNRLREVKALDALQNTVPAKTWFQKVAIEGNAIRLSGFTQSAEGLNDLITRLGESAFSQIEIKGTTRVDLPSSGPATNFELEFRVGKE